MTKLKSAVTPAMATADQLAIERWEGEGGALLRLAERRDDATSDELGRKTPPKSEPR